EISPQYSWRMNRISQIVMQKQPGIFYNSPVTLTEVRFAFLVWERHYYHNMGDVIRKENTEWGR
ncbi:MAG: hypothetical protein PHQ40_21485, partial [Anaerolineaceae bacterium]|nr:hypothetical protein [Anaerolineaceae bacterium]